MSGKDISLSDCDIQSYVDGELDPAQRAEVDRVLACCPMTSARVNDYLRINETLRKMHVEALDEGVPERFLRKPPKYARRPLIAAVAAGFASVLLGALGGWLMRGIADGDHAPTAELLEYAVSAHAAYAPEVRHPVEVAAEEEQHLVAWLSKRLDADIRAPKLEAQRAKLRGPDVRVQAL